MGETNFHFFSCSLSGKMALDILGIRMELGHGMQGMQVLASLGCFCFKTKTKEKTKRNPPNQTKAPEVVQCPGPLGRRFYFCAVQVSSQQLFVYSRKSQICWTSSNSLVLGIQKLGVRVTCVQLVHLAFLKKY